MNRSKSLLAIAVAALLAASTTAQTRRDHAVFFPVTDYPKNSAWAPLEQTLPECKAIAGDLENMYGFSTEVLANQTKAQIKTKLGELAARKYGPQDQLLLFFSMHGHFDEEGEAGCLVPYKGLDNDPNFDTWLLHTELRVLTARIPCEHILIVLDACYSGTFGGARGKPDPPTGPDCATKISNTLSRKSRLYLTAGGKEKVPAASDFARRWRIALNSRGGEDGILTFTELQLQLSEANPTPRWGDFTGHLGGGFVFVSENSCAALPSHNQDTVAWRAAQAANTIGAYRQYQRNCTLCFFSEEADAAISRLKYAPSTNDMVLVRGGTFQMGSNDGDDMEKPAHTVTLSDFYLCKYEVTVAQFRAFVEANGYQTDAERGGTGWGFDGKDLKEIPGRNWRHDTEGNLAQAQYPVTNVTWNDAMAYCRWLSQKTGQIYRLPTEAEWEYAAGNGVRHTKYSWSPSGKKTGNVADKTFKIKFSNLPVFENYDDGYAFTAPVGSFEPNDLGLYDMTGNVWEWCSDWYDNYSANTRSVNPTGPKEESCCNIHRGGSWYDGPHNARVTSRFGGVSGNRDSSIGFRLARSIN